MDPWNVINMYVGKTVYCRFNIIRIGVYVFVHRQLPTWVHNLESMVVMFTCEYQFYLPVFQKSRILLKVALCNGKGSRPI
jgi:hypothetical protein